MEEMVTATGIPMYARMIHNTDGTRKPILYGKKDQYIMSVDRRKLNEDLLTEAEKHPGVRLHFSHKLVSCNVDTGEMHFKDASGKDLHTRSDLIVGCDGAYSAVRQQMMKSMRFDFSQEYIPHGYMELHMPPSANGKHAMETNYLHIWPRNAYMMIALPNQDGSFTVTMFMPFEVFEAIQTEEDLMRFFKEKFPDSLPLLGEQALKETFFNNKALPMVSVKCGPYHHKDKLVIMGDAAHAMVPFYGQGMNCGFEDCLIFNDILDQTNNDFGEALKKFTAYRNVDARAMCDLAMYNYIEMRASVNSKLFLLRKKVDNFLHWLLPDRWIPLYTMVSFTRTRYHKCINGRKKQDMILERGAVLLVLGSSLFVGVCVWRGKLGDLAEKICSKALESANRLYEILPLSY
ncbi:kynurenine 3-monooxygenase isoform X2 [Lingula anatina]|nr:kynurenine 3-monooxygenase isoform X2 [Lingula anatina]|eukprot:XP_013410260.1 kynurenine 3-monooxygenase isoform X2 [Lingula anatina]